MSGSDELVVPPGAEPILRELLAVEGGWSLLDWAARKTWIDARFRRDRDELGPNRGRTGELAVVRLLPPGRRPPVEHRQTERFTIALVRGSGTDLLAQLHARIGAREHRFTWQQPAPRTPPPQSSATPPAIGPRDLDLELLSFRAGVKPALRLMCAPVDMIWNASLLQRHGAATTLLPETVPYSGGHAILMVARTLAESEAMAEAYLHELATPRSGVADGTRELGRRLGYPDCCVEAFAADQEADDPEPPEHEDPLGRSRTEVLRATDNWRRFNRAWVARPAARLNSLLFGERLRLISFDPCRFDCTQALALADAMFTVAVAEASEPAHELDRWLARAVAVDAFDRRAWVSLARDAAGLDVVTAAEPIRVDGSLPAETGLAERLLGRRVDASGRIPDLGEPEVRVFRFDLNRDQGPQTTHHAASIPGIPSAAQTSAYVSESTSSE